MDSGFLWMTFFLFFDMCNVTNYTNKYVYYCHGHTCISFLCHYYLLIHKGICKLKCNDTIYVIILVTSKYKVVNFFLF